MRRNRLLQLCFMLFTVVFLYSVPVFAAAANVPKVVVQAANSVVYIESGVGDKAAAGSGFVVYKDQSGTFIATNNHVIEDGTDSIYIWISDSIRERAEIVAKSETQDLVILHLPVKMDVKPLTLNEKVEQGEEAYAIGFPAGADALSNTIAHVGSEATITSGIVSSIREASLLNNSASVKILQISVDINSGNSGGPLLNHRGEVIGVNALGVIGAQGINGAISSEELIKLIKTYNLFDPSQTISALLLVAITTCGLVLILASVWLFVRWFQKKNIKRMPLPAYLARRTTPLDCNTAVSLLMPLALYLKNKHDAGSVSLRLFPGNIIVTSDGCRLADSRDNSTERFLSPEQRKGSFSGIPADIYSFCAVLDYMLEKTFQSIAVEDEKPDEYIEIRRIIGKGLSKQPTSRYVSMQELIFDLAPLNTGISVDFVERKKRKSKNQKPNHKACTAIISDATTIEQQAKDDETKKRTRKKKALVFGTAVLSILIVALSAFSLISRNTALQRADGFDFDNAVKIFYKIPFGKVLFPKEQEYLSAAQLVVDRKYDEAEIEFRKLGNYRKASAAIIETKYQKGVYYLSNGDYLVASLVFSDVGDYRDAVNLEKEARLRSAVDLVETGKFDNAIKVLKELVSEKYDPARSAIYEAYAKKAEKIASDGHYGGAYETLLEAKKYGDFSEKLKYYREAAYQAGIAFYRSGENSSARLELSMIGNYLRTEDYLLLLYAKGTSSSWLSPITSAEMDRLKSLIGFEDTAYVLVMGQSTAVGYLAGTWRGDGCYFSMKMDGQIRYNLPYFNYGDYYKIEKGYVLLYPQNNLLSTKKLFRITVLTEDCIRVFAFKNNKAYKLYRE
ncbi:MAG: trypsin-like peptidase domain-containing protein [Eubacteriales bacterium]|nr:trypsin-like peptidase domain-containing protein [Eubacteriales bacterium]